MNQEIRFCAVPGGRVAYATLGDGPPLVVPAPWVSHLECDFEQPEYRAFMSSLAERWTVLRYDRLGTGLSDRVAPVDDRTTLAAIVDHVGLAAFDVFGISAGAVTALRYAAEHPDRVRSLALFGAFADGAGIAPPELRAAIVATVRAHWGAGARMLADVWMPGASAALRERITALQRAAASADVAAATLEAVYATDLRPLVPHVTAPALVMHRRDDRAVPYALGRDLAARLPDARFVPLDGAMHPPWLGTPAPVLAALLDEPAEPGDALSPREREVLALVGAGLSDAEIAERLVLSPHTVHRHVANIRAKLAQPSRAAAAAYAARRGLI
ncbi:alpha/beta fold hydrolase [Solirubrobacter sp. CPCC 204708]|uniref:Alpha/beta fold hydrolase n=1 Tax=Solirubrobacter deserti TaxID=2282478 RepID=A0ABT4RV03_9ACTN|nr:alpha/beta fold hydrolase [Solirubrobacter deserti]MBE2320676.1 alpha/beta fold hydrolase [Solirubrobacter deserti]MDA0142419.1 alpha/beta fold hydrolase [Solirubrobacter deserti]